MSNASGNKLLRLVVEVSDDRLQAWIHTTEPDDQEPLTREEIIAGLEEAGIAVTDAVREKAGGFLSWMQDAQNRTERYLVAEGQPPVEGRDEEFVLHQSLNSPSRDPEDGDCVDWCAFNSIMAVDENTPIGRIAAAVPGKNGVDVHGKSLESAHRPAEIKLDSTVRRADDDPSMVIANVPGKIVCENDTVSIEEVVVVKGDADPESGNVNATTNVSIEGNILDQLQVISKKSIIVGGSIQAAQVKADGDVFVRGGIIGRNDGKVITGGQIVAKFAEEAELRAEKDIKIAQQTMNSRVHCRGKFHVTRGAVIGGEAYAREGIEVAAIGNEAGVCTSVIVGVHPCILDKADQITEEMKTKAQSVERIRKNVQPLMDNLKRLTPAQKERATELLFNADSMADEISEAEVRRDQMIQDARTADPPVILVSDTVFPGARIRIGRRQVVFKNKLRGPVKIEERKLDRKTEFVAVDQMSGSVTVLKSARVAD